MNPEVLALITQGKSNAELAELMFISINTVKSYIRSAYRKIGVTNRTQAVLRGTDHGFRPDHHRIEHWRGGPLTRMLVSRPNTSELNSATGSSRRSC